MAGGRGQEEDGEPGRAGLLSATVLVARERELGVLAACVASPPSIVAVEGEAGVGKTRLVAELVAASTASGPPALVGRCHPLRDPFPLGPVVEALRGVGERAAELPLSPLGGALRALLPELADHLPPPLGALADPRMERHRLWRAVVELLGALAPVVIVLEDLHWADEATAEFLVFLASQVPPEVAVVLTWRPADLVATSPLPALVSRPVPPVTAARVSLDPLGPGDVKALVGSILGSGEVSNEFVDYLHERTAGIPFAVEEVLRLLQDRHDLVRWEGRWARRALDQLEVPAAVRESVLERVERLEPGPRQVVEAAAVIGRPADEALLAAVAGLPAARANTALVGALDAALLWETSAARYDFRHTLASEAVYSAIPAPARRRLHRRAAVALEGRGKPSAEAQLARHCKEGGHPVKWVRHARAAAAQAAGLGEHAAAAEFLFDALSAPRLSASARGEILLALSIAALHGTDGGAATVLAAAIDDEAVPVELRGKLAFNLGSLLHQAGDASGSRAAIARAVPQLRNLPAMSAVAMSALASPWVIEGDLDEHLEWLDRADALVIESELDDIGAVLRANRSAVLLAVGDPTSAASPPAPPPADATEWDCEQWVRTCTNLAVNHSYLGRYDDARRWGSEAAKASASLGYYRLAASLRATDLVVRWATGDWAGLAHEAARLEEDDIDVPASVQACVVAGLLDLAQGRVPEAEARLGPATDRAARCGALPTMGMASAGLARSLLARGEPEAASSVALGALEPVATKGIWAWAAPVAPAAVEALVACGRIDEAAEWVRRFSSGLVGRDAPAAGAALLHCRALVEGAAGRDPGGQMFDHARAAWAALPRPYEAALAVEGHGRTMFGCDREAGAAAMLAALAGFRELGATWDELRVRQELRRHEVELPYPFRGGHRGYDDALSPREHEVVELAAGGATSSQIAKVLFLSSRTVDHHIERALRKLGLASRRELVAARDTVEVEAGAAGRGKIG